MLWLDHPLPALDGRTPRQASQQPGGKNTVRRLSLSIEAPAAYPGTDDPIPRAEMLREQGLQ